MLKFWVSVLLSSLVLWCATWVWANDLMDPSDPQIMLLAVYINGQDQHQVNHFLQTNDHKLWITAEDLQQ